MVLIIGGAYQGKLEFAIKKYNLLSEDIFYCDENLDFIDFNKKIIYNIDRFIFCLLRNNKSAKQYFSGEIEMLKDKIIICQDISCGVVPIDSEMRLLREEIGHTLALLSRESDEVFRLFCGIGSKIK